MLKTQARKICCVRGSEKGERGREKGRERIILFEREREGGGVGRNVKD